MAVGEAGRRLRAADLARAAGLSVQQIRNYVAWGLLPPVERTPAGYRIFTGEHLQALAVVRRMAEGHGWARTRQVLAAVHQGDLAAALAALDAGHAELDRERSEIRRVLEAFDTVLAGRPEPGHRGARGPATRVGPGRRRHARIGEVARLLGVRTSQLRAWEAHGLLCPAREPGTGYRVYDEAELRNAQVIALLRRGGYPLSIVRAVLDELRATGSPQRVRAELARREQDLHRRGLRRLRASAALYDYLAARGLPGD